jgi:hypothetical protein
LPFISHVEGFGHLLTSRPLSVVRSLTVGSIGDRGRFEALKLDLGVPGICNPMHVIGWLDSARLQPHSDFKGGTEGVTIPNQPESPQPYVTCQSKTRRRYVTVADTKVRWSTGHTVTPRSYRGNRGCKHNASCRVHLHRRPPLPKDMVSVPRFLAFQAIWSSRK